MNQNNFNKDRSHVSPIVHFLKCTVLTYLHSFPCLGEEDKDDLDYSMIVFFH